MPSKGCKYGRKQKSVRPCYSKKEFQARMNSAKRKMRSKRVSKLASRFIARLKSKRAKRSKGQ